LIGTYYLRFCEQYSAINEIIPAISDSTQTKGLIKKAATDGIADDATVHASVNVIYAETIPSTFLTNMT
jgi:hypothetical protein